MKTIASHTFKHTLKDIHKNTENRKFCFILGAGTSRKSGIPTGGELAERWFSEINDRLDSEELKTWIEEQKINETNLASSYGNIYRKRFENDKTSGYDFLVQAMKNSTPSFGHIVIAQILSRTPGHCVLTTNFDSLVESSVYQFTNKTPLVCGHESLSGYARPSQTHPLIIKIHRDLLLAPQSDPDEINQLHSGWKEPLDHIFSTHIPIVIGYGGNDGSLMSYFENMNKPSNFFWCFRNKNDITSRIENLISKHDGRFVEIKGFDELMHELLWVFDEIKPVRDELNEITNLRIQIVTEQLNELTPLKIKEKESTATVGSKDLSALEYSNLAQNEPDFEKRKEIYLEALDKYSTTDWLWWEFTYFMHFRKWDYTNLDIYYAKALELNKNEVQFIINYAIFSHRIEKNFVEAEKMFLRALELNPNDSNGNAGYAGFLKDVKNDIDSAEKYLLRAIEIDPNNALNNVNYAQILLEKGQMKDAEFYLEKAISSTIENETLIEIWFYRYAHYLDFLSEAESKIEELLAMGIRSIGWNFNKNIEVAITKGHPDPSKLKSFAYRIINK